MEETYMLFPNNDGTFTITKSVGNVILRIPGSDPIEITKDQVDNILSKGKDKFTFDKKTRTLKEKKGKG